MRRETLELAPLCGVGDGWLKFYNLPHQMNPKLPLAGKRKGGGDASVCTTKMWNVDFKVYAPTTKRTNIERAQTIFQACMKHYATHETRTNHTTLPFVLSVYGTMFERSIDLVRDWADFVGSKKIIFDLQYYGSVGVLRGLYTGYMRLQCADVWDRIGGITRNDGVENDAVSGGADENDEDSNDDYEEEEESAEPPISP